MSALRFGRIFSMCATVAVTVQRMESCTSTRARDLGAKYQRSGFKPCRNADPMAQLSREGLRNAWPSELTRRQTSMIRFALAKVKPCQRAFLRYAFPQNGSYLPFVLFFQTHSYQWSHVFWTNNIYYKSLAGEEFGVRQVTSRRNGTG